ncbi:hypothetical protein ACFW6F_29050 [Streptomyces sp. NPDC058746]|uniref:hypothetical protein n=1 Tax=Streptomyces sp. NPDC058746 TaxID=3346622 RepID=UPI00367B1AA1
MSDGRRGPDVPRPDENAGAAARAEDDDSPGTSTPHGTTPSGEGGSTDPTPGQDGIIVQGGRTASAVVGRQLGHDPATIVPQAVGTPSGVDPSAAPAPSLSIDNTAPTPVPSSSVPAAGAQSPTPAASAPPAHTASPGRSAPPAQPKPSSTPAPAAVPVLALRPNGVQEYCVNGEWPNSLVVRNSGSGHLDWSVGKLPPGVTVSQSSGSLAADDSQVLALGGRTEQQPANGRFTIGFTGNGGSGQVTVTCA